MKIDSQKINSKIVASIISFAIGDAMGTPLKDELRDELMAHPVLTLIGHRAYPVPAGTWSDDTSLTLATMDSIIQKRSIDHNDIMNKYLEWYGKFKYTATEDIFDVSRVTYYALINYASKKGPAITCGLSYDEDNDNASLMRMLPIAIYAYYHNLSSDKIRQMVNEASSLTHRHEISRMGCYIYVRFVIYLLQGDSKEYAYEKLRRLKYNAYSRKTRKKYKRILERNIKHLKMKKIKSSDDIVDTLEASMWVILNTIAYKEAMFLAVNLGDDADTVGAVTGSMAGLIYGWKEIPLKWLDVLKKADYIINMATSFENILEYKTKPKIQLQLPIYNEKNQ